MKGFALLLTQVLKSYNIEPEQVQHFFNTAVEMAQKLPAVVDEFQSSMQEIRFAIREQNERLLAIEKVLDMEHRNKVFTDAQGNPLVEARTS